MPKGNFKKATESIVPLRGVVRDGKLAAIIDQNGVELGMPVTSIENLTGGISIIAKLTQAEYDAIAVKDDSTLYVIV